jgi:hypothetical protein
MNEAKALDELRAIVSNHFAAFERNDTLVSEAAGLLLAELFHRKELFQQAEVEYDREPNNLAGNTPLIDLLPLAPLPESIRRRLELCAERAQFSKG